MSDKRNREKFRLNENEMNELMEHLLECKECNRKFVLTMIMCEPLAHYLLSHPERSENWVCQTILDSPYVSTELKYKFITDEMKS